MKSADGGFAGVHSLSEAAPLKSAGFAVRDAGWRAIRTEPLPLVRHEHRGWEAVPEAERERLSRRNFYRFLERWRDRPDLLLHPDDR